MSSSNNGRRYETLLEDCLRAGWSQGDAARFSGRILRDMPGLARAELRPEKIANVGEVGPIEQPADFLFCDSKCKSR
jgi:hypothetical protein